MTKSLITVTPNRSIWLAGRQVAPGETVQITEAELAKNKQHLTPPTKSTKLDKEGN